VAAIAVSAGAWAAPLVLAQISLPISPSLPLPTSSAPTSPSSTAPIPSTSPLPSDLDPILPQGQADGGDPTTPPPSSSSSLTTAPAATSKAVLATPTIKALTSKPLVSFSFVTSANLPGEAGVQDQPTPTSAEAGSTSSSPRGTRFVLPGFELAPLLGALALLLAIWRRR
jgi:hypothetical protein